MKHWREIVLVVLCTMTILQQYQIHKVKKNLNLLNEAVINVIDYVQNN
jgi:hypothetical protein